MKNVFLLLYLALSIGCNDSDGPEVDPFELRYDGANLTSPNFPAGINQVAVRFAQEELARFEGKKLTGIDFYLYTRPEGLTVRIYDGTTFSGPGMLLFEAEIPQMTLYSDSWNEYELSQNVEIPEEALWITMAFEHTEQTQIIGCDAGPMQRNSARIWGVNDSDWQVFNADINWNIRGKVED